MITGLQIRAARAILKWSVRDLAEKCGVSYPTISKIEQTDGVPTGRSQTLIEIQKALEKGGIVFTGTPDDEPGVKVNIKPQ
ncbi:MAG: XRE family transcriptional regulator [Alphaproteobacteria bacterium]|nr:XRE family transcriptional regulator [Alphaproteobacteria bacterium]